MHDMTLMEDHDDHRGVVSCATLDGLLHQLDRRQVDVVMDGQTLANKIHCLRWKED